MHKDSFLYWLTNILLVSYFFGCGLQASFPSQKFLSIDGPWEALQSSGKLAALQNLPYCFSSLASNPWTMHLCWSIFTESVFKYLPAYWPSCQKIGQLKKAGAGLKDKSGKNGPDLWILDIANLSPQNPFPSYFGIFPSSRSMIPP